ncbi:hypothetical protein, partial [Rhizobium phaseoli]|uniref:hypothetical protein n=1 Tax=Rhizobium phaseoli TaxID=396 RepID=UPI001AEC7352
TVMLTYTTREKPNVNDYIGKVIAEITAKQGKAKTNPTRTTALQRAQGANRRANCLRGPSGSK